MIALIRPIALAATGVIKFGDIIRKIFLGANILVSSFIGFILDMANTTLRAFLKVNSILGRETSKLQNTIDLVQGQINSFNKSAVDDFGEIFGESKLDAFNDQLLDTADIVENKLSKSV